MFKKIIPIICAVAAAPSVLSINTNAKVIEPEVVKTETWTTSYYIDDDIETLYPYIQCEADIYNDGTLELYMWNTHEWDGFTTIKHKITLCNSMPTSYTNYNDHFINYNNGTKISYFPNGYNFPNLYNYVRINNLSFSCKQVIHEYDKNIEGYRDLYEYYADGVALPTWETSSVKPKSAIYSFYPTLNVNFSKPQYFRLFGHDITITPELLSGNITPEPQITEQEKYIQKLEQENAELKNQLSSIDCDLDGLLTCSDAQMILNYYVDSLAGGASGKIEDYPEYLYSRYYF